MSTPTTSTRSSLKELTFRGIIIGGIITLLFTAANVYLGLKVGLTFATSIPAAVISMAILRFFADHTIQENNIVQTIASAAGTLSAVIFILPGLVIVGWWSGFPYWTTMAVCAVGGLLGVMYSIPLRRALVTGSDLPYPEGVAGAEILKVGDAHEKSDDNTLGLHAIIWGSICSAAMSLLSYMKVASSSISATFKLGAGATSIGTSLSLALIGVGHLVGLTVGIAMLIGMFVSYFILIPYFSVGQLDGSALSDVVDTVFSTQVRYIGAGVMAVAAIWTLIKIISPIVKGIRDAMRSSHTRHDGGEVPQTERDIPITVVALVIVLSMIPVGGLLWLFTNGTEIAHNTAMLIAVSVIFTLLAGLLVAAVCGYMAGLIGSSNSPVSGVGILVVVLTALAIVAVHGHGSSAAETTALIAYTLFTAAIVFCIATISNDNLQDLKTGQLVNATPWKQQVALVIGVVFGALVIPPVLNLMQNAFGFQGAPNAGADALAAPQGLVDFRPRKGRHRWNPELEPSGSGRHHRHCYRHHRRSFEPHDEAPLCSAAFGSGHGHVSARLADHSDPGRWHHRLLLRSLVWHSQGSRARSPYGYTPSNRSDRRREPLWRDLRRHCWRHRKRRTACRCGRFLRNASDLHWCDLLHRKHCPPLPLDSWSGCAHG